MVKRRIDSTVSIDDDINEPEQPIKKNRVEKANLVIAFITAIMGFANLVPTIYFTLVVFGIINSTNKPPLNLIMLSFSLAIIAIAFVWGFMVYMYLKENRKSSALRLELKLLKARAGLDLEHRDLNIYVSKVLEYLLFKRVTLQPNDEKAYEQFFYSLVNNVKNVFDRVTGEECSACIKIVTKDEGSVGQQNEEEVLVVKSMCRDRASYDDRAGANDRQWYPIKINTAFYRIISPKYRNNYFWNNDLPKLAAQGKYNNGNDFWFESYKSTVVVPIMYVPHDDQNQNSKDLRAFLCIDSFDGKFDKDLSVNLLRVFSQIAIQAFLDQVPPNVGQPINPKN